MDWGIEMTTEEGARIIEQERRIEELEKQLKNSVQVVRCKDCKHYDEWLVCPLNTLEKFDGNGFCNRGERRE